MIFLIGGSGNLGSLVTRLFVESGEEVLCLLHDPTHRGFLPEAVRVVEGDARNAEWLGRAMAGARVCVCLAHIRFAGTVAEGCRRAGVSRLICLSSTRRYTRFPCESSRAVIGGEAAVEASGLDWTILRPSLIYGGGRDNNVRRLVEWCGRHRWFPLIRGGRQLVQPVFVGDVAAAVIAALSRPETIRHSYTLAGPKALSFWELVEAAASMANKKPVFVPVPYRLALGAAWVMERLGMRMLTVEQVRRFLEDKCFEIEAARKDLGFNPVDFEEGLRREIFAECKK